MAKISFTADDGSIQEFDVVLPVVAPAEPSEVSEVVVEHSDGSSENFVPETSAT